MISNIVSLQAPFVQGNISGYTVRARAAIQAIVASQAALIYQDQVHRYTLKSNVA